jgi:anti-sigma B factor antagonist
MNLEIHKKSSTAADVSLAGSFYAADSASVREQLVALVEEGVSELTLECSGLDYVDSEGLRTLLTMHKRCLQHGGRLTITGLRGMVEEMFRITCLDLMFNIGA